jgi:hypothetical protein
MCGASAREIRWARWCGGSGRVKHQYTGVRSRLRIIRPRSELVIRRRSGQLSLMMRPSILGFAYVLDSLSRAPRTPQGA